MSQQIQSAGGKESSQNHSSSRSVYEIVAVIATGGLHLILADVFRANGIFIALAISGWSIYVALRVRSTRSIWKVWGFKTEGLLPTLTVSSVAAALATLGIGAIAWRHGALGLHSHMLPLFLLYPVWGLTQQFLVQGMVSRNLSSLNGPFSSLVAITLISSGLFAMVHLPDRLMMLATFLLGLVFTPIYLKWRNLWPLGLYHGWLGVFAYFWLIERDPLIGLFGS
jgi:hypothetical protein